MTEYTEKEKQNFAKNLSNLIEKSGLSTQITAEWLGYSTSQLYKWRNGQTFPKDEALEDVAYFYKATVRDLVGDCLPK